MGSCATILDFDGVLVDSIAECYTVSSKTYFGFSENPHPPDLYRDLFWKYRYLVRPPYQYMVLHKAIRTVLSNNQVNTTIPIAFQSIDAATPNSEKDAFTALFFKNRELLREDEDQWVSEHRPTKLALALAQKPLPDTFILTTKDKPSVEILKRHFNLNIETVFGYDDYHHHGSKGNFLTHFLDTTPYEKAIFVDDATEHLDSVTDSRVQCFFADWGYQPTNDNYPVYPVENG